MQSVRVMHLIGRRSTLGVGGVLEQVAANQVEAGHTARIVAMNDRCGPAIVAGTALGARWGRDPLARRRLRRLIADQRPDIVHAWDAPSLAASASLTRDDSGTAQIATLADPPSANLDAARHAAGFLASDRAVAKALQRHGVDPARVSVAERFALAADPLADQAAFREQWQIPADAPIVAAAAELTRDANLADTIWGFELLRLLHREAVLVVAGEGPDHNRLQRQVRLMSEPASARFVPGESLGGLLAAAALFCDHGLADRWPVESLAAISAGVPTVAAERRRTRAAFGNAKLGYIVGHGDRAAFGRIGDRVLARWEADHTGRGKPARAAEQSALSLGDSNPASLGDIASARASVSARPTVTQDVAALYARVLQRSARSVASGPAASSERGRRQAI
ncbi:MAG: glycosyltransferase [Planctomycetota bacterium]